MGIYVHGFKNVNLCLRRNKFRNWNYRLSQWGRGNCRVRGGGDSNIAPRFSLLPVGTGRREPWERGCGRPLYKKEKVVHRFTLRCELKILILGPVYSMEMGDPHAGEVTRLGGVTRLCIESLILIWSRLRDRLGDPQHVTSPIWCPPLTCKQALTSKKKKKHDLTVGLCICIRMSRYEACGTFGKHEWGALGGVVRGGCSLLFSRKHYGSVIYSCSLCPIPTRLSQSGTKAAGLS